MKQAEKNTGIIVHHLYFIKQYIIDVLSGHPSLHEIKERMRILELFPIHIVKRNVNDVIFIHAIFHKPIMENSRKQD